MVAQTVENPLNCGSQKGKAKSQKSRLVARIARLVRQMGLSYDDWRYVARQVRRKCDLHPAAKPKRLPRVLTADQFRAFYKAVDAAEDVQHALMLRLLFYTGVGSSELCSIEVADVDLENCKIFVNQGKGAKDRYVLFGKSFATALENPHRRPPQQPLVVPDQAVREVLHPASAATGSSCMPRRRASMHAAHLPPPSHHLADPQFGAGRCRIATHHRAFPADFAPNLPARRRGRAVG